MTELEFNVLGPIEVRADGRLLPIPVKLAMGLLARLLLNPNQVVATDVLVDDLFGPRQRRSGSDPFARDAVRLQRILGPESVVREPTGYALRVDRTRTDVYRFEQFAAAGHERLDANDPAGAAEAFRLALDLWRGPPLEHASSEAWAVNEVRRLEELRLNTMKSQIDACLQLNDPVALSLAERLVARYPLDQQLHGQLMRALHRAGREADALAAYEDFRRTLGEVGLEPSRELQELHAHMQRPDPPLLAPAPGSTPETDEESATWSADAPVARPHDARTAEVMARLFDDWAFRLGRGEWPDPHRYLRDAGADADELRRMMDAYIRALPRPAPVPEDIERARAWLVDEQPQPDAERD